MFEWILPEREVDFLGCGIVPSLLLLQNHPFSSSEDLALRSLRHRTFSIRPLILFWFENIFSFRNRESEWKMEVKRICI